MGRADFPWLTTTDGGDATAVVLGHVNLELLNIGARRGLPARVLLCRIEVVGQVLAAAVAHLPS